MPVEATSVWVLGASGDLAHKKTFPSIFDLFVADLLPRACAVVGFARTAMTDAAFRETLRKYLPADEARRAAVDAFLQLCVYRQGAGYGDVEAFRRVAADAAGIEDALLAAATHCARPRRALHAHVRRHDPGLSKDDLFRATKELTEVATTATEEVSKIAERKRAEIEAA